MRVVLVGASPCTTCFRKSAQEFFPPRKKVVQLVLKPIGTTNSIDNSIYVMNANRNGRLLC